MNVFFYMLNLFGSIYVESRYDIYKELSKLFTVVLWDLIVEDQIQIKFLLYGKEKKSRNIFIFGNKCVIDCSVIGRGYELGICFVVDGLLIFIVI